MMSAGYRTPARFALSLTKTILISALAVGCLEQYDPAPHNKRFQGEYETSVRAVEKLEAAATTPAGAASGGGDELSAIKAKYVSLCGSCHGNEGGGDGPSGAALTPKPRNFTDAAWHGQVDDARIISVIKGGGAAVGLSAMMPPMGASLSEPELVSIVKLIRSFKK